MVNLPVLVLNQGYEPLNVCRVRRALVLVLNEKAEVLENGRGELHAIGSSYEVPSVIRLVYSVKRPRLRRKLTKFEIFNRDHYTCQYCGRETKEPTLDHVMPKRRGGEHSWTNIVTACVACNRRKAGHTPEEAHMKLLSVAAPPKDTGFHIPFHQVRNHKEWHKYLPQQYTTAS
jgi:5-methylcytosine-specific restriction endonuclease McrA